MAGEHVDKALLGRAAEEGRGVGPGDVGVELVRVELGEDEPGERKERKERKKKKKKKKRRKEKK